jgi:type I restriction enzyme R subunit
LGFRQRIVRFGNLGATVLMLSGKRHDRFVGALALRKVSSVIPYSNAESEKLSIFLNLLTQKLPAPKEEDLSKEILEAIDMDSYRVEKKAVMKVVLGDEDSEIEPVPIEAGGRKGEPELDRLSNILKTFNDQLGTLFADTDRVAKRIREDIAPKVAADTAYQNAKEHTLHTARIAHDEALGKVMQHLLKNDAQVYKQFVENESFRRFIGDMVYHLTSETQPRRFRYKWVWVSLVAISYGYPISVHRFSS